MKSLKLFNLIITVTVMLFMLSACETDLPATCPDLQFTVDINADSTDYTIMADFEGIEDLVYGWYVNDDLVETEDHDESRNNTFDFRFAPGTYTICIIAESAECGGSVEFCQEVTIRKHEDDGCPELEFEKEKVGDHKYLFTANFPGMDTIAYSWYVDGDFIEVDSIDGERHHLFDYVFEPGEHKVCIIAETDSCGVLEFCRELEIGEEGKDCPELFFTKEKINFNTYLFTADFEGRSTTAYTWYVDGDSIESVSGSDENHHKFDYEFGVGEHVVCIKADEEDCEAEYCKVLVIEEPVCPVVSFVSEQEGPYSYEFEANFENKTHTQYKWFINGEEVDKENFDDVDTNHHLYWQFEPGAYTVCIVNMATDHCEATEFCKELVIEEASCVAPEFEYEITDNGYKFFANFEGKHDTHYTWYLNGDAVENENPDDPEADRSFTTPLDSGSHTICIVTTATDRCEAVEYCKTITVEKPMNDCVSVSYTAQQAEGGYQFVADFDHRDDVTYIWKVFINDDLQGSEVREAGSNDDHEFFWQFEPGVLYEICLKQDGCSDTMQCQTYSID